MNRSVSRAAHRWIVLALVLAASNLVGARWLLAQSDGNDAGLLKEAQSRLKPLPKDAATPESPLGADRVRLGRQLFFETRISVDGVGSCVKCHLPALYGSDGLPQSRGIGDKVVGRNAPTVLNSAAQFRIHWDGVFATVEEQVGKALLGPGFGNADEATVTARIKAVPGYADLFRKAFPGETDPVTVANVSKAVGAYERTLMTPSRFDEFLAGRVEALSADERRGLGTFLRVGCAECHSGAGVGGDSYRKFGVLDDYWKETRSNPVDKGRFELTKKDDDLYSFKVPTLRNVAMTAPYFHDGSVTKLGEAVRVMAAVQLGATLSAQELRDIVTFLESLTGKLPEDFATAPVLPPGGFLADPGTK